MSGLTLGLTFDAKRAIIERIEGVTPEPGRVEDAAVVGSLAANEIDYDYAADRNVYPRIVTLGCKDNSRSFDHKHRTIIVENEDDWGWTGRLQGFELQGRGKAALLIWPKFAWMRVD